MERRLAAILAADVVDYTRLMGEDQQRTLNALRQLRDELLEPSVTRARGQVIKRLGDGWIVEFPSISDAVACAIEVQEALDGHDLIHLRIGIHTGEVVFEDEDVFGDGVNVAARLEERCDPDGILISDNAQQSLDGKTAALFAGGEAQELKNVSRPVGVWRWPVGSSSDAALSDDNDNIPLPLPDKPSRAPESTTVEGFGGRPAVAVLPFDNMSGDSEQEYFTDGITEDIITELSRWRHIPVIARNSTFTYKGRATDVKQIAKELGVAYVVEGSVRKGGDRIRITAQLIDASSGQHVWADRYDREIEDIFALQDEITERIVTAIDPAFRAAETQRAMRKPPKNLDAWDHVLRGTWHFSKFKKEENAAAREEFRMAIEREADFATAHASLGLTHFADAWLNWTDDRDGTFAQALEYAKNAVALDDMEVSGHQLLAAASVFLDRQDAALREARRAVELNPSLAMSWLTLGYTLTYLGQSEDAIPCLEKAIRLSPNDPANWIFFGNLSLPYLILRRYEDAFDAARRAIQVRYGYVFGRVMMTSALAHMDRIDEAKTEFAEIKRLMPNFSRAHLDLYPFKNPSDLEHILDGLRKAGLPEV